MSSSEYHHQLMSLFDEARLLKGADRARFVREAGSGDERLARDLTALLRHDEQPLEFVRQIESGNAAAGVANELIESLAEGSFGDAAAIDRLGQFKIERLIAEGGMGSVYLAMQQRPQRLVALKVMRRGFATPSARRRFEFETEVLARLRHPSVAQIYEVGVHEEGGRETPYFAMEYIASAQSVTKFADARGLDARARAALIARVCEAVHHGHQRGVIHRDLKPDNILVDEEGRVKVIDFGVARAVDREAEATAQTQAGQLVGTISYMSPEQLSDASDEIDVRSDVYSLGVVLYELVVGRLPYPVGAALGDVVTAIRAGTIAPPRSIVRRLNRDLELIVLKALEREPARRYASAAELGADIERWLRQEPIVARPPSSLYQLRRFAQRNRALVGGVAGVVVVLAGGIFAERYRSAEAVAAKNDAIEARDDAVKSRQTADAARSAAEIDAARALRVTEFLDEMIRSVTPDEAKGRDVTVREVLDKVAGRIDAELQDAPAVEATVRLILGQAYAELGAYKEAEQMLSPALEIHTAAGRADAETAKILHKLGSVQLHLSKLPAALASYDSALEIARGVEGPDGELVLSIMNNRGHVLYQQNNLAAAAENLREIEQIRLRKNGEDDPELRVVRGNLGSVLQQMGRNKEARELIAGAFERSLKTKGIESSDTLELMNALAGIEFTLGNTAEADRLSNECIAAQRTHLGPDHPSLAESLFMYGTRLANTFRDEEAEKVLRESMSIRERAFGQDSPPVADVLGRLGSVLSRLNRSDEGIELLRRAVEIHRRQEPISEFKLAWSLHGLAQALTELRRLDEARVAESEAVELLRHTHGNDSSHTLVARAMLAFIDVNDGRYADALGPCEEIVATRERVLGVEHHETTIGRYNLADVYFGLGRFDEAREQFERVIPRFAATYGQESSLYSATHQGLALTLLAANQPEAALAAARTAWKWVSVNRKPEHPTYAYCAALLVAAGRAAGVPADELPLRELATAADPAIKTASAGAWRPAFALLTHSRELRAAGQIEAARPYFEVARDVLLRQFGDQHAVSAWIALWAPQREDR